MVRTAALFLAACSAVAARDVVFGDRKFAENDVVMAQMDTTMDSYDEVALFMSTGELTLDDDDYEPEVREEIAKQYKELLEKTPLVNLEDMGEDLSIEVPDFKVTSNRTHHYDDDVARRFAQYSAVSYCPSNWVKRWKCGSRCKGRTAKTTVHTYLKDTLLDVRGYTAYNTEHKEIIVSFRGSVNIRNWITNLRMLKVDWDYPGAEGTGARVHKGFYDAYHRVADAMIDSVTTLVKRYPTYAVVVAGHSQGGAMAVFAALDLLERGVYKDAMRLWTYGEPRMGNQAFAEYARNTLPDNYRVVNKDDLVPHLPPKSLDFRHHSTEAWIRGYFQNDVVLCAEDNGEDSSCSSSLFLALNPIIHLQAFDTIFFPTCFF